MVVLDKVMVPTELLDAARAVVGEDAFTSEVVRRGLAALAGVTPDEYQRKYRVRRGPKPRPSTTDDMAACA